MLRPRQQRTTNPLNRSDPIRLAEAVRRDLAQATHIPGDISTEEINRRYQAALRDIHWRHRCGDHTP